VKFYDCKTAPSPRRLRIFLAEKSIEMPTVEVDLAHGEQLSDAFRKMNPYCTVPVLELDDGSCITECFAICQYLEDTYPEPRLMGRDAKERALVTMWNTRIENTGLGAIAEAFRNKAKGFNGRALTGAVNFEQIPDLVARGRTRAEIFLGELDEQLAGRDYVAGDVFTVADITAVVAVDFAGWIKLPIPGNADSLRRWHEQVSSRPSMLAQESARWKV